MRKLFAACMLAAGIAVVAPVRTVYAHHSAAAEYDVEKVVQERRRYVREPEPEEDGVVCAFRTPQEEVGLDVCHLRVVHLEAVAPDHPR